MGTVGLSKFLIFLFLSCISLQKIYSDDLKIADIFEDGDVISAETFNQIFETIEKINRTVKIDDLIGTWNCSSLTNRETKGWVDEGFYYSLSNAQVNIGLSLSGTKGVYTISTSSPSPFKREGTLNSVGNSLFSGAFSGTFSMVNNKLFTKFSGDYNSRIWDIDLISPTRFELTFLETSASTFPAKYASYINCDSAKPVPSPPLAPKAVNDKKTISIEWTDSSSDEIGFKIYKKEEGFPEYSLISTQDSIIYRDTETEEGKKYYYYVVSYNNNGESAKSKIVSAIADSTPPIVISTFPSDGSTVNTNTSNIKIIFSEKILIVCPVGSSDWGYCPVHDSGVVEWTGGETNGGLKEGKYWNLTEGTSGSDKISFNVLTQGELWSKNQENIIFKVNKDWIIDMNGNQMEENYIFNFKTGNE